jgi:hypothetical protein
MRTAVLVLVLVLVSVGLYGGWMSTKTLWPGLHSDACLLSTVVINRANGQGNTFDSYTRYLHLRNGNRQFNFHGQLYYPILAATIPGKGYEQFLRVLHWSNLVAFSFLAVPFQSSRPVAVAGLTDDCAPLRCERCLCYCLSTSIPARTRPITV